MVVRIGEEKNRSGTRNKITSGLLFNTNLQEWLALGMQVFIADHILMFIMLWILILIPCIINVNLSPVQLILWRKFTSIVSGSPTYLLMIIIQIYHLHNVLLQFNQGISLRWTRLMGKETWKPATIFSKPLYRR
jgi:hypothetical protein